MIKALYRRIRPLLLRAGLLRSTKAEAKKWLATSKRGF